MAVGVSQIVLNELNSQDHWLMIVDNLDIVDLIKRCLPIHGEECN